LTLGGIIALTTGSLSLFNANEPFLKLSKALVATTVITTTGLLAFILPMIIKSQKRKASSGVESLIGASGEAKTDLAPKGIVHVSGEDWYAESPEDAIKSGEKVKIVSVDGLTLKVEKVR
jgi:membrane-bound serine protease (ClpP class)